MQLPLARVAILINSEEQHIKLIQGRRLPAYLIHISYRPSLSDGKLNGQIVLLEMGPAVRGIVHNPHIIKPAVESGMVGLPAIATSARTLSSLYPTTTLIIDVPW